MSKSDWDATKLTLEPTSLEPNSLNIPRCSAGWLAGSNERAIGSNLPPPWDID